MNIDEQVSAEIYHEIIIDLLKCYRQQLNNGEYVHYNSIQEFYKNLDDDGKNDFMLFLDGFAMDIVSIILGGFDGSTKLGKFFGGFSVNYQGQELTPYLQENFLGIYQDNYDEKTKIDVLND